MLAATAGFFPLDRPLELQDRQRSEGVLRQAVWLSGLVEFALVAEILERIGGIHVSASSVWRSEQKWGQRLATVVATEQAAANRLPEFDEPPLPQASSQQRLGVALDGTMVPIRQEGTQGGHGV